jgi:hypothetical protein
MEAPERAVSAERAAVEESEAVAPGAETETETEG